MPAIAEREVAAMTVAGLTRLGMPGPERCHIAAREATTIRDGETVRFLVIVVRFPQLAHDTDVGTLTPHVTTALPGGSARSAKSIRRWVMEDVPYDILGRLRIEMAVRHAKQPNMGFRWPEGWPIVNPTANCLNDLPADDPAVQTALTLGARAVLRGRVLVEPA